MLDTVDAEFYHLYLSITLLMCYTETLCLSEYYIIDVLHRDAGDVRYC